MLKDVGHKFVMCLEQLSLEQCSHNCSYMCSYKVVPFYVASSLELDMVDSVDVLLNYGFKAICFVFCFS